jgi:hypothetical protein
LKHKQLIERQRYQIKKVDDKNNAITPRYAKVIAIYEGTDALFNVCTPHKVGAKKAG